MTNTTSTTAIDSTASIPVDVNPAVPVLRKKTKSAAAFPPLWLVRAIPWVVIAVLGLFSILHHRDLLDAEGEASSARIEAVALEKEKESIKTELNTEIVALSTQKSVVEGKNKLLAGDRDSLTKQLSETSSKLTAMTEKAEATGAELKRTTSERNSLVAEIESMKSQLVAAGENAKKLSASLVERKAELEASKAKLVELSAQIKAADGNIAAMKKSAEAAEAAHEKAKSELTGKLSKAEKEGVASKLALMVSQKKVNDLAKAMDAIKKQSEIASAEADASKKEAAALRTRIAELEAAAKKPEEAGGDAES